MGAIVILQNPFDATDREVHRLTRATSVRRIVQRHKGLRRHTAMRRPGGIYGKRRVREFVRPTVCLLNGEALTRAQWGAAKAGPGDVLTFYAAPLGGQGGIGAILGIVLAIAIVVAAPYLAGPVLGLTGTWLTVGTAVIGLGLSAVAYGVMSLFSTPPPQAPGIGISGGAAASPTYSLQGQGNAARLEQPIPELLGRHQIFPDYIGQPYVRYVDNEQLLHFGYGISMGEVEVETDEIRIGETPISVYEEIVYAIVEPGGAFDTAIWDPRWIPTQDMAQVRLPGDTDVPPSPWEGPFIANPANTVIDHLEFDLIFPRGLWATDPVTTFRPQEAIVEIEVQEIDDLGGTIGGWVPLDELTINDLNLEPLRFTYGYDTPSAGRWQVQMRRNDTDAGPSTSAGANQVDWAGLRGRLTTTRTFADMTTMAARMKATGDLSGATSRKLNMIVTRKLPTWDPIYGEMSTELTATRNPCDAFVHIARTHNGGRLADAKVDLAGIYAAYQDFEDAGWTFDFVFDQSITVSEALARVARSVVAERVVQGGELRLVRDIEATAPVAMFGPRNIRRGSVDFEYKMIDSTTADALVGTYIEPSLGWKPVDVTVAFDDSPQERPARMVLAGITNRAQLRHVLWNLARGNRYRRRLVKFATEMEGLAVLFGDPIAFSHDVPRWGQTAEVLNWNYDTRVATLSDEMTFTPGVTDYVVLRDRTGMLAGPYEATKVSGQPYKIVIGAGTLPEIFTGGDRERTFIQFGPGEEYARRLKVIQVTPKAEDEAEIIAIDDDPRMYEEIPEDEDDAPIGSSQVDIEVLIDAPASDVNLRTIANANGYVGTRGQAVTITIDTGVEVTSVIRGTWPSDYRLLTLINNGIISGAGGAGGAGTVSGVGGSGSAGGAGLDTRSGAITVDNTAGTIRGGGGGGGGAPTITAPMSVGHAGGPGEMLGAGGGTGGGGRGNPGGAAGVLASVEFPGAAGTAGSTGAAGTGGAGNHAVGTYTAGGGDFSYDYTAPDGGAGGDWGAPGSPAGNANYDGVAYLGGPGGRGGQSVAGEANVTWLEFGATLAAIEEPDIADFAAAPTWGAALAATEETDIADFAAAPIWSAALDATETADTADITIAPLGSAALIATETTDVAVFAAAPIWSAALVATEPVDTAAFIVGSLWNATLAATEAADVAAFAAAPIWSAALAATEAADTAAFAVSANVFGATYYITPTGSDAANGLTVGTAWLSPNHAVNAGDRILVQPGTYSSANFGAGKWGTVSNVPSASGIHCAILEVNGALGSATITSATTAIRVDKSNWAVIGFECTTTADANAPFECTPSSAAMIHHVAFINCLANEGYRNGFSFYPYVTNRNGNSFDYVAVVGCAAYRCAKGATFCHSGISMYEAIPYDSTAGTHIYIGGNFCWDNLTPGTGCGAGINSDGNGIIIDDMSHTQNPHGYSTDYNQTIVVENNILIGNGWAAFTVFQNGGAPIIAKNNTTWGNLRNPLNNEFYAGEMIANVSTASTIYTNNIAQTDKANAGLTPYPCYACYVGNCDADVSVSGNVFYGVSGRHQSSNASGAFAYGSNSNVDPLFASVGVPGAPNPTTETTTVQLMANMISDFTASAGAAAGKGYQPPGAAAANANYPTWLKYLVPDGLVTLPPGYARP